MLNELSKKQLFGLKNVKSDENLEIHALAPTIPEKKEREEVKNAVIEEEDEDEEEVNPVSQNNPTARLSSA